MRTLYQSGLVVLGFLVGAAGPLTACREKPAKEDCEAAAKIRARHFFDGSKDTGSARQTKRAKRMEFDASVTDCMSGWSKQKAQCVAKSKNRNMMISCK
ncbi:MAG: hypothetical protein GY811_10800 [Myxococcales bacterium]|nr:hypothetical protein [Myxococcales bacterium]